MTAVGLLVGLHDAIVTKAHAPLLIVGTLGGAGVVPLSRRV